MNETNRKGTRVSDSDGTGTVRSFPPSLESKLAEAVQWHDERIALESQILASRGNGAAQRNQEDLDASDRTGGALLLEIMEEMDEVWGFGRNLRKGRNRPMLSPPDV